MKKNKENRAAKVGFIHYLCVDNLSDYQIISYISSNGSEVDHSFGVLGNDIRLIFSERRLLPEPEVKIAIRSVSYDELDL